MELFRNTNYDFLGKKWPFIIASLILTAAGLISLVVKGGPRYGIEFKGGMLMTVKFLGTPPLDELRSALDKRASDPRGLWHHGREFCSSSPAVLAGQQHYH